MPAGGAYCRVAATLVSACLLLSGCPDSGRVGNDVCLTCHQGTLAPDRTPFMMGTHRFLDCETCHGAGQAHIRNGGRGGLFIYNPDNEPFERNHELCQDCHPGEAGQYLQSEHAHEEAVRCTGCHDVHETTETRLPFVDNALCLHCHGEMELPTAEAIVAHTFHPYDPAGTGASRCTRCHMPPLGREDQAEGPHLHRFEPIPPITSNETTEVPTPPNSCSGIMGCHDGTVQTAPVFDVDNPDHNVILQILYDERYGEG